MSKEKINKIEIKLVKSAIGYNSKKEKNFGSSWFKKNEFKSSES